MEVLFEYRGSRRELAIASRDNLTSIVTEELRNLGRSRAVVLTSEGRLPTNGRGQNASEVYLLQKWSTVWNCYVDVRHCNDVIDGDKLAVLARPKPPSKLRQMFCCASDSSLPNGNRVGNSSKHPIPKGEEIQTVNYQFRVMWDQEEEAGFPGTEEAWLQDLEQESANVALHQENLKPGEQYVRDTSGIASWKIMCKSEPSEESEQEEDIEAEVGTADEEEEERGTDEGGVSEIAGDPEVADRLKEDGVEEEEEKVSEEEFGAVNDAAADMAAGEDEGDRGEAGDGDGGTGVGGREQEGGGEGGGVDGSSSPAVLEVTSAEEWGGREDDINVADDSAQT